MYKSTTSRMLNTHPKAYADEKEMLETLKMSANWREGTLIKHDWDKATNQVTFIYDFPESEDPVKDIQWEKEITDVIKQYPKV